MSTLLEVNHLTMNFKGLKAVNDFSATLEENKIYGLIGTNGAGKTTIINMLSGVLKPSAGTILFNNVDITGLRPDKIAKLGILRTYQNLRLFKKNDRPPKCHYRCTNTPNIPKLAGCYWDATIP